jgi:hypothetical protein
MTGPSLANLWGRKAGSLPSFDRYSDALRTSGIIWDDRSLDAWLTDPDRMVPDNEMPFEGIKDERARADLLAFLKEATKPGAAPPIPTIPNTSISYPSRSGVLSPTCAEVRRAQLIISRPI